MKMSFLGTHLKAAVFFGLGVAVAGVVVSTTLYADAQFGRQRLLAPNALRWATERKELSPGAIAFVVAKCSSTETVDSGGYDLAIGGADPAKVYVLAAHPSPGENGYKTYVANGSTNTVLVFSYAGCRAK